MLATYMRRMRNNNLEIGIAGSSCRPECGVRSVECGVRSLENEENGEKEKEQNEIKTKVGFNNQFFFV